MTRMRRIVGLVAVVWLSCRLASAALAPLAVWAGSADGHAAECTCVHGPDAACPMHKKAAPGSTFCVLQSTAEPSTALLTSPFGLLGLVAERTQLVAPASSRHVLIVDFEMTTRRAGPPDPPPPRV